MTNVVVNIGATYEVLENYGKYLKAGEMWNAWYYGELILLEVKQDGKTFSGRELPYSPSQLIKAINAGKVREVPKAHKWTLQEGQTGWEPEAGNE